MLKHPRHKLQSSLGSLQFALQDLPIIRDNFDKKNLLSLEGQKNYNQALEQITLAVLSNHLEIMRQSFKEFIDSLNTKDQSSHARYLEQLSWFLFDLRNAHNHTENELTPKWGKKINIEKFFTDRTIINYFIDIPFKQNTIFKGFHPQSKKSLRLSWLNIKSGKEIIITNDYPPLQL